jgi:hypothetical protein
MFPRDNVVESVAEFLHGPFADYAFNRPSAPFERVFQKRPPAFEGR